MRPKKRSRYRPTLSRERLEERAQEQGLKLWRSQATVKVRSTNLCARWQTQKRWILCRADWVDHKEYHVYRTLTEVDMALVPVSYTHLRAHET